MDAGLKQVDEWFDNVNRALPEGITIVPGPNYPAGAPRPLPADVKELLQQADVAIEKARDLLKRSRAQIHKLSGPFNADVSQLLADINDLLGD